MQHRPHARAEQHMSDACKTSATGGDAYECKGLLTMDQFASSESIFISISGLIGVRAYNRARGACIQPRSGCVHTTARACPLIMPHRGACIQPRAPAH